MQDQLLEALLPGNGKQKSLNKALSTRRLRTLAERVEFQDADVAAPFDIFGDDQWKTFIGIFCDDLAMHEQSELLDRVPEVASTINNFVRCLAERAGTYLTSARDKVP